MRGFDWDDIQAFLAISRAGRLTVAAQQMSVDHSTLSRRIAALESALGVRLFDRSSLGFVLTSEGERVLSDAESMESLALCMRHHLDNASIGLTGSVRIGTPEGFGTYFLAPRIAQLSAAHPQLEIELIANPRMFSLSKREANLAVSMTHPAQGRVYAHKFTDYALGVYASKTYLDTHRKIASRCDLLRHPWVGYVENQMWSTELNYLPQISNTLVPGFNDPVHDAQRVFRALLEALSRPGSIVAIDAALPNNHAMRDGLMCRVPLAAFASLLALTDYSTLVFLESDSALFGDALRFHASAPLTRDWHGVSIVYIDDATNMPSLKGFSLGEPEAPETSATLFIRVPSLTEGESLVWRGPGIQDHRVMMIAGLPAAFWQERASLASHFPRGIDCYFVAGGSLVGLPRTTHVEVI